MSLLTVAKSCQRQLISKIPQPNQVPNFSINLGVTHLFQDCRRGAGERKTEHLQKGGCNSILAQKGTLGLQDTISKGFIWKAQKAASG